METGEVRTSFCGTKDYMSPEIVLRNIHSNKTDIWSLGILLYEMLHGNTPYKNSNIDDMKKFLIEDKITYGSHISI